MAGVALASVVAEVSAAGVGTALVLAALPTPGRRVTRRDLLAAHRWRAMLVVNVNIFIPALDLACAVDFSVELSPRRGLRRHLGHTAEWCSWPCAP